MFGQTFAVSHSHNNIVKTFVRKGGFYTLVEILYTTTNA